MTNRSLLASMVLFACGRSALDEPAPGISNAATGGRGATEMPPTSSNQASSTGGASATAPATGGPIASGGIRVSSFATGATHAKLGGAGGLDSAVGTDIATAGGRKATVGDLGGVGASPGGGTGRASGAGTAGKSGSLGNPSSAGNPGVAGTTAGNPGSAGSPGIAGTTAGNPGVAGTTAGSSCAITVGPTQSIQSAIDRCPVPGTVCVQAGTYQEDLVLRDGVNVKGAGTNALLCGGVHADAATHTGATLSDLSIFGAIQAVGSVRLSLQDLDLSLSARSICGRFPPDGSVDIKRSGAGGIRFQAKRVKVRAWGFVFTLGNDGGPARDDISITESRCVLSPQCWDFFQLHGDSSISTSPFARGSHLNVELTNNLVQNIVLEGVALMLGSQYLPEDVADSRILIRHNTLIVPDGWSYAIVSWQATNVPVILANNAIAYTSTPLAHWDSQASLQIGNWIGTDAAATAWFEDFNGGNFLPSAQSPLRGTGDVTYGVPSDIEGHPRVGSYDVGAYQR